VIVCSILSWYFRVKKKRFAMIINITPMLWISAYFVFMFL
jgi:hypothetical protein